MEFYKQLIKDLAEVDPGLNDGITQSYFDLSMVDSLSDAEKEGLAYMGGTCFGAWGELATEKDLVESGALDPPKGAGIRNPGHHRGNIQQRQPADLQRKKIQERNRGILFFRCNSHL